MSDQWDILITLFHCIPQDYDFHYTVRNVYENWHCKHQRSVLREILRSARFITENNLRFITENILRSHIEARTGHSFPKVCPVWLRNLFARHSLELDMSFSHLRLGTRIPCERQSGSKLSS